MTSDSKGDRGASGTGPGSLGSDGSRREPPEGRVEPRLEPRNVTEVVQPRWMSRAPNALVLSLLALCCAYLLTPGLFAQRIPFGEESLNTFSTTVVKATRDYDIPDEETTRKKREEAREAVLPVYDYDLTVAEAA